MSVPSLPVAAPRARDLVILDHVQWQPPGAVPLWSPAISLAFAAERCGLVGRNGTGKSVLCRLLAGLIEPGAGRIQRPAKVAYVPQSIEAGDGSLARASGFAEAFDALARIESGRADGHDWSIAESLDVRTAPQVLCNLALALDRSDPDNVQRATNLLDLAISNSPSQPLYRFAKGQLLLELKEWSSARKLFEELWANGQRDRSLLMALVKCAEGQNDLEAMARYERMLNEL